MKHQWITSILVLALLSLMLSCRPSVSLSPTVRPAETRSSVVPTMQVSPALTSLPAAEATATHNPQPVFGMPRFYLSYRNGWDDPGLVAEVEQFPSGLYEIHAVFEYENVPPMEEIEIAWYRSGNLEGEKNTILSEGSGSVHSRLQNSNGLPDGVYDYRIYYQGKVVQHRIVNVGWKPTVFPLAFTDEDVTKWDKVELPSKPKTTFPAGVKAVYYVAWVANLPSGILVTTEWYVNGQIWATSEERWNQDKDAGWWMGGVYAADGSDLPRGKWEVSIYLDKELARVGNFTIE